MVGFHPPVNQGEIDLLDSAAGELRGQVAVRGVVARDQNDAAGEAVEAVHDAGPEVAADAGQLCKSMQQGVHQSSGVVSGACVDYHAGRFVHGDDRGVFIEDFKRQILGRGAERGKLAGLNFDFLQAAQQVGPLLREAVHTDAAGDDPILQARAAVLGEFVVQELIEPAPGVAWGRFQMKHRNCTSYIQ